MNSETVEHLEQWNLLMSLHKKYKCYVHHTHVDPIHISEKKDAD